MKIGDKVDLDKLGERQFDINELFKAIRSLATVWSWGAHAWMQHNSKWLRFKCNGHHHKGHVYITLAWNDTFTIYYTTTKGKIEAIDTDIYVDMLIDTIDQKVEYVKEYNR